jgi:hypothetical protein
VASSTELTLTFSEALDKAIAEEATHYQSAGMTNPISAVLQSDLKQVILSFADAFSNGVESTLQVSGLTDTAGNTMTSAQKTFLYFQASPISYRDVIISEFFPDFSPKVGIRRNFQ